MELTFFVHGHRDGVDRLQFDAGVGEHLQLHRRQREALKTCRR